MHAENDDSRLWPLLMDAPSRLDPIEIGHGDVDDNDIRLHSHRQFDSFTAIGGLGHHRKALLTFQQGTQATPDHVVIIRQQNSYLAHSSPFASCSPEAALPIS